MRMLKQSPTGQISAIDALNHPYFQETQQEEEEYDSVAELNKQSYPSCQSPLLLSSNPDRKMGKLTKKDSCVEFRMGKENVFTGKVDTIAETGSTNNSVGRKFEPLMTPKMSKFTSKK